MQRRRAENAAVHALAPLGGESGELHDDTMLQLTQESMPGVAVVGVVRFGKVEEIAAMVCWLASEECSFSTGAVFDISGGRAVY